MGSAQSRPVQISPVPTEFAQRRIIWEIVLRTRTTILYIPSNTVLYSFIAVHLNGTAP